MFPDTTIHTFLIVILPTILLTVQTSTSTGAFMSFHSVVNGSLLNVTFNVAPADFGYQPYGKSITAMLILPANKTYHQECGLLAEPNGINHYIGYINNWFISEKDVTDFIVIIDRGCQFTQQVTVAERIGAVAAIICDDKTENLFTMASPQGETIQISIPSMLLEMSSCATLMQHIGVQNWNPTNTVDLIYHEPVAMAWTIATIEWVSPPSSTIVQWQLWTDGYDQRSAEFKQNFASIAIDLINSNHTTFTPHMYILNGSHWGCDSVSLPCRTQCTNSGRYCVVDPEHDMMIGLDGADVVEENLRSLCVWKYDETAVTWWNYAHLWDENCGISSNSSLNYNANCSFAQMIKLRTDNALSNYVKNCISTSGGYGRNNGTNSILETDLLIKKKATIAKKPILFVNTLAIEGALDNCIPPITTDTCTILNAICVAFQKGKEPDICNGTSHITIPTNCSVSEKDCNNICFGSKLIDACGQCLDVTDPEWNSCVGCDGILNSGFQINPCGRCILSTRVDFTTFDMDCTGTCDGNYQIDDCGYCLPPLGPAWNRCMSTTIYSTTSEPIDTRTTNSNPLTSNVLSTMPSESTTSESIDTSNTNPTKYISTLLSTTSHLTTSIATDTATESSCPLGCLLYYDGCNSCWCNGYGEYVSCSNRKCNDTDTSIAYCEECNQDKKECNDGSFALRLLELYCDFDQCSDDSVDINSNDTKYYSLHTVLITLILLFCIAM